MRRLTIAAITAVLASACGANAAGTPPDHVQAQTPVVATLPPAAAAPQTPGPSTTPPASGSTAAPASSPSAGSALLAFGKKVYETAGEVGCSDCHGPEGKGGRTKLGDTAPDIRGATEVKLRNALGGGAAAMSYIKLDESEIEAVVEYLRYLNDAH